MAKKLVYFFDKNQRRRFIIIIIIMIIGALFETLGVSAISPLVSVITNPDIIYTNHIYSEIGRVINISNPNQFAVFFAIILIFIFIFKNVYLAFMIYVQNRFVYTSQRDLSVKMLRNYLVYDYLDIIKVNVAELQRNVTEDVRNVFTAVMHVLQIATETFVCMFIVVFLLWTDFRTTSGVIIVLGIFMCLFIKIYKGFSVKYTDIRRDIYAVVNKWILQVFSGIKEVKASDKELYFLRNYEKSYSYGTEIDIKSGVLGNIQKPIIETICICSLLVVVSVRIYSSDDMSSFIPVMASFAVAAFRLLPSINRVSNSINDILIRRASIDNLYDDLYRISNKMQNDFIENNNRSNIDISGDIQINDVSFKYPDMEVNVFSDVSFTIKSNESVAFVGPSGAGKSTLADIILGIIEPSVGSVSVGNIDVYKEKKSWHQRISYIPQSIYLLDDTIRNNVAFGIEEEDISDERVWEALAEAQIDEFVRKMPNGLDSFVGDRGVKLSGGQRQRIGIARALYSKPSYLILDEATSALDNETEAAVMEAIESLHGKITMIIIAHRLSTIKNCDVVYRIENGSAKEEKSDKKQDGANE